jgi:hypothetical protein
MKTRAAQKADLLSVSVLMIAVFLLGGCTSTTGQRMDRQFGQCVKDSLAAQVINADAPDDPSYADALPGDLAGQIYTKRYVKSMTEEKKENDDASSELSGLD